MTASASEPTSDLCLLQNRVFTTLGAVSFQRAETDGTPVMIVALGDRRAAVPLRSLQREFQIEDDSPDGRMLALIAESLDYVAGLHLGDKLPAEVLTGKASWQPEARYRRIAAAKLRLQLIAWVDPSAAGDQAADAAAMDRLETDPAMRARVQRAFEQAARALELPGPQAVMAVVEGIAEELSYIEALRDELLARAQTMAVRLSGLSTAGQANVERQSMLARVRRLAHLALQQIAARFADVDAQTGEVMATLRNADSQRAFIRSNRDWLYRTRRAWEPVLADWAAAPAVLDDAAWLRVGRTYQFLAPRFMPVQEWETASTLRHSRKPPKLENVMRW